MRVNNMIEIDEVSLCKDRTLLITLLDLKGGHMRVGTLVNHENYFGVGIVIDTRNDRGKMEWKILWLREGKDFGWSFVDYRSVEIICK